MKAEEIIRSIEAEYIKDNLPTIHVGDTVRVGVRIREGNKERVQPYEGTVIAMRNGGINRTITVRRIFQGVGVERVFLVHSPRVADIKVLRPLLRLQLAAARHLPKLVDKVVAARLRKAIAKGDLDDAELARGLRQRHGRA